MWSDTLQFTFLWYATMAELNINIKVKWNGNEYNIQSIIETDTVADLKAAIYKQTNVLPERQKLMGLKYNKGKPPLNDVQISDLKLRPNMKIMMMGSLEETLKDVLEPPSDISEVVNDFDVEEADIPIAEREEFLAKVNRRIKEYSVKPLNDFRPGKKLLVLDIDYTLFDHRSTAECAAELMRPYLHEFLTAAYVDYDIVIWCK
ncbi:Ubiquitin-like domain-containing CTD phosphatase 1 [Nymphon striatum]|nr:Ubiquitin-like domain-containing CTD phosphatase 1 [Nymphon striatum]